MKNKMFAVYDAKVKAFLSPFFMRNSGEATRGFESVANDEKSSISHYPEDYSLFELGEWDDETGNLSMHEAKVPLGTAIMFKKNEKPVQQLSAVSN